MPRQRYEVGDKVLVSRAETGEDHELGEVVDSYELLIGGDQRRPMIVVVFEDGERKYFTATTPNVFPVEPEEDEIAEDAPPGETGSEGSAAGATASEVAAVEGEISSTSEPKLD
jgi:hypothetical protein